MDRGPVALFGAIVAVGLGPALWLGAQVGRFDVSPPGRPVPVDRTHDDTTQLMGSTAGGEHQSGDDDSPVGVTPRAHVRPLKTTPSASPSPSPTDTTPSASPSASDSSSPSASPSDSTTPPDNGGGGGGDDSQPPSPPTGNDPGSNDPGSGGPGGGGPGGGDPANSGADDPNGISGAVEAPTGGQSQN